MSFSSVNETIGRHRWTICALIFAATYILLNLLADIISIATNPRLLHPR